MKQQITAATVRKIAREIAREECYRMLSPQQVGDMKEKDDGENIIKCYDILSKRKNFEARYDDFINEVLDSGYKTVYHYEISKGWCVYSMLHNGLFIHKPQPTLKRYFKPKDAHAWIAVNQDCKQWKDYLAKKKEGK